MLPFNVPLGKPAFKGLWCVSCFNPGISFSTNATVIPSLLEGNKLFGSFKLKAKPIRFATGPSVIYL